MIHDSLILELWCVVLVLWRYKTYRLLSNCSFQKTKNMAVEKKLSVTINFYQNYYLAVITGNKKYLSKQVHQ